MNSIIFNSKTYVMYICSFLVGIISAILFPVISLAWLVAIHGNTLISQNIIIFVISIYIMKIRTIYIPVSIRDSAFKIFIALILTGILTFTIYYFAYIGTYIFMGTPTGTKFKLAFTVYALIGRYLILIMVAIILATIFISSNYYFYICIAVLLPIIYHYFIENYFVTPIVVQIFN